MVRMVVESVERIFRSFPRGDAGEVTSLLKLNKKLARSVGHIFEMDDNDSQKEEEIRKYSIIYGRFDSKRREGKQLSLHEVRGHLQASEEPHVPSLFHCPLAGTPCSHPHLFLNPAATVLPSSMEFSYPNPCYVGLHRNGGGLSLWLS